MADNKASVVSAVKTTAIGTAAVVAITLQIIAFRAVGDILSSVVIFGLGYLACFLRK